MTEYFTKDGDDYKKVENFTQEQIDDIVGNTDWLTKRLERERSKYGDYDDLKTKVTTLESEKSDFETKLTEATEKATNLEKEVGTAKLETSRVKIVGEFKLPDDLAEFVTGDSEEDMRGKAEKLAKGVKPASIDIDKNTKPEGKDTDSKQIAGKLFGNKSDD